MPLYVPAGSGGVSSHDLLDGTVHPDTAAGAVARGDVLTGQGATPKWTRLAKGAANTVIKSDGTDLAFGKIVNADIDAAAAIANSKLLGVFRQLVSAAAGGDFSTSSATLVDVTNATISITTGASATILLLAMFPVKTTGDALFDWKVDGSALGSIQGVMTNTTDQTMTLFLLRVGVSAAAHSFQLQGRTNSGPLVMNMSSVMNGTLIAAEYR